MLISHKKMAFLARRTENATIFKGTFHDTSTCQNMYVLQSTGVPFLGTIQTEYMSNCYYTQQHLCENAGSD